MFTSCGWFFEELSRPEGTQILRYAARAMELAAEITGIVLEPEFLRQLAAAPSNVSAFGDGATVYQQLVRPAQVSFEQIVAHYAMDALVSQRTLLPTVDPYSDDLSHLPVDPVSEPSSTGMADGFPRPLTQQTVYCYDLETFDYQLRRLGTLTLAVGQVRLRSQITWESRHLIFAALHLGDWDFHCCVQDFSGRRAYSELKAQLLKALERGSAAQAVLAINQTFPNARSFSLADLFAEDRHHLMQRLSTANLRSLDQLYAQVYRDNYGILLALHRDELTVPRELQVAAEVALGHRLSLTIQALDQAGPTPEAERLLIELEALAEEAHQIRCSLDLPETMQLLERFLVRTLRPLTQVPPQDISLAALQPFLRSLNIALVLGWQLNLLKHQELIYTYLHHCYQQQLLPKGEDWGTIAPAFQVLCHELKIFVGF